MRALLRVLLLVLAVAGAVAVLELAAHPALRLVAWRMLRGDLQAGR